MVGSKALCYVGSLTRSAHTTGLKALASTGRPTWVSNLLVVLCGEKGTQPVVNTGSQYQ